MNDDLRLRAEDLPLGATVELGEYRVTREEIIDFAAYWDPLPLHLDPEMARQAGFDGVIGSGMHTLSIYQRLAVLGAYKHWAIIAGRGLCDLRLTSPLRPDTTVRANITIDSVTHRSPTRALVSTTGRVLEGDLTLMTLHVDTYVFRRA